MLTFVAWQQAGFIKFFFLLIRSSSSLFKTLKLHNDATPYTTGFPGAEKNDPNKQVLQDKILFLKMLENLNLKVVNIARI